MASKEKVSPVSSTDKTCKDKTDDYPGMVSQRIPEHMDLKRAKAWHEDVYRLRLEGTFIPRTALATAKSNTGRKKEVRDIIEITSKDNLDSHNKRMTGKERTVMIEKLTREMKEAARMLEFEHAAFLRDKIAELSDE